MAQTPEQFFSELCKEAGYSPEDTAALLKLAANDKAASRVSSVLKTAQDDYNAQLGRQKASDARLKEYEDWYAKANTEYNEAMEQVKAMATRNGNGAPPIDTGMFVTKKDLESFNNDISGRWGSILKDVAKLSSFHAATWHEPLDVDGLEKLAQENRMSLTQAYDSMMKPRAEAREKEKYDKALKEAKEEGAREALSRHKLPVDSVPGEVAPMYRTSREDVPKDMDSALLEAWNSVPGKK